MLNQFIQNTLLQGFKVPKIFKSYQKIVRYQTNKIWNTTIYLSREVLSFVYINIFLIWIFLFFIIIYFYVCIILLTLDNSDHQETWWKVISLTLKNRLKELKINVPSDREIQISIQSILACESLTCRVFKLSIVRWY